MDKNIRGYFIDGGATRAFDECKMKVEIQGKTVAAWKSVVHWPVAIRCGNDENTTEDKHSSYQAAAAVCESLRQRGFGMMGKVFPLKTRVDPIFSDG